MPLFNPVVLSSNAVGSSPNANGISTSGTTITLQPADGSNPGVVTTAAQTIAGDKTFTGQISALNVPSTAGPSTIRRQTIINEDWITGAIAGSYGWVGTLSTGTIAMNTANEDGTHWGIIQINSGAANGNAALISENTNRFTFGSASAIYAEAYINFEALSSGTNDYTFRCGFMDNWTGAPNNGAYFEYVSGTSTNWRGLNANGGGRTNIITATTAVAATTWIKLGIKITSTTTQFFINDVSQGTASSTNFSTGAMFFGIGMNKNANGATSRFCLVDYVSIYADWSSSR